MFKLALILCLLAGPPVGIDDKKEEKQKPKRVELTGEQNKLISEIHNQLRLLEAQINITKARGQGLIDAFALATGLNGKQYRLVLVSEGRYAIEEIPPPSVDEKGKETKP